MRAPAGSPEIQTDSVCPDGLINARAPVSSSTASPAPPFFMAGGKIIAFDIGDQVKENGDYDRADDQNCQYPFDIDENDPWLFLF